MWHRVYLGASLLALPAFVMAAWLGPSLDHDFFCGGGGSCFREWVTTLSGYVAGLAAFLTIRAMNRTQAENVELTVISRLADAKNFLQAIQEVEKEAVGFSFLMSRNETYINSLKNSLLNEIGYEGKSYYSTLKKRLNDPRISAYRMRIGMSITEQGVSAAIEELEYWRRVARDDIEADVADLLDWPLDQISRLTNDLFLNLEAFISVGRDEGAAFITRWDKERRG